MTLADITSGASNFISGVADAVIFWKNWDPLSRNILYGVVLFIFISYIYIKNNQPKENMLSSKRPRYFR